MDLHRFDSRLPQATEIRRARRNDFDFYAFFGKVLKVLCVVVLDERGLSRRATKRRKVVRNELVERSPTSSTCTASTDRLTKSATYALASVKWFGLRELLVSNLQLIGVPSPRNYRRGFTPRNTSPQPINGCMLDLLETRLATKGFHRDGVVDNQCRDMVESDKKNV